MRAFRDPKEFLNHGRDLELRFRERFWKERMGKPQIEERGRCV